MSIIRSILSYLDATSNARPVDAFDLSGVGAGPFQPIHQVAGFAPIPGKTVTLAAGPAATAAPVALPACIATSYRARNAAASPSPVTWILSSDNTKVVTIPTAYSTAGTGGVPGDKTLDPGGVGTFYLTPDQQTALAAGALYLSAICPASGSATLSITPGNGS